MYFILNFVRIRKEKVVPYLRGHLVPTSVAMPMCLIGGSITLGLIMIIIGVRVGWAGGEGVGNEISGILYLIINLFQASLTRNIFHPYYPL